MVSVEKRLNSYKQQFMQAHSRLEPAINRNSLTLAAEFFGFDDGSLDNPEWGDECREMLLYILADVLFGPRKRGRPRRTGQAWDFNRLYCLLREYNKEKARNPNLSTAKIAEIIHRDKDFKNDDPQQIRQQII